ncbi:MAG: acyltransferase domain-containing protein [Luteitalea sp.]|nr:acyltransferase domain-containing protein [Luteitalea sp.]
MHANQIAVMFPGQGVLDAGVIERSSAASAEPEPAPRSPSALRAAGSAAREPEHPEVPIYRASLAAYSRLQHAGVVPDVLIGHGFGEIAALVVAGAFSMSAGAEIVAARSGALGDAVAERYGMASIQGSRRQVSILLKLLETDGVSLAAENSSHESVIVGPPPALWAAADLAAALDIPFVLLKTNRAPHRRLMNETRATLTSALRHVVRRPLQYPVFSPLRGRPYCDSDDLIDCLAQQLVEPIRFADAVAHLVRDGLSLMVECGPLRGLASTLDCHAVADTAFCRRPPAPATATQRKDQADRAHAREVA